MLAIDGGPKVRETPFPARHLFGEEERAVALKPSLPQARFNLVTGLLKLERYRDALGHLETLAADNPDDIQIQRYLEFARAKLREAAKPER